MGTLGPSFSRKEESTKYLNFSASDEKSRKEAEHRYHVRGQEILVSAPLSPCGAANIESGWEKMERT